MKYLKRYESFYNEEFKTLKENFGKRESDEEEKSDDQDFDKKEDTTVDKDVTAEVETPTMESKEESVEDNEVEAAKENECEDENCEECNDEEKIDEGALRKFLTGHDSPEDRDKAMIEFHKALDEAQAAVDKAPEKFVFSRDKLEKKARANNYKGGLRIQRGGRDKSRFYVVYDEGVTGFQQLASGAGDERRNVLGM